MALKLSDLLTPKFIKSCRQRRLKELEERMGFWKRWWKRHEQEKQNNIGKQATDGFSGKR